MTELWETIEENDWQLQPESILQKLKDKNLVPIQPIQKIEIPNRHAFHLAVRKLERDSR